MSVNKPADESQVTTLEALVAKNMLLQIAHIL